ncbi:FAD-dependent oxidoreductase [Halorussus salinus]|uniref:FAD-dependent oxidoreductase n=1 Tax=Halorussus salinus TaxID=1364935 RepID=UPI001091BD69|nr:FAD-dependent oxidoreductase [Halorussus salinus]
MTGPPSYEVVVYGATMPGVAAARNAARLLDTGRILLVNPQPGWGGIGGVGGQNFWDCRYWERNGRRWLLQGGSFREWYRSQGQAYNTDRMQQTLREDVTAQKNIDILDGWDITATHLDDADLLTAISLRARGASDSRSKQIQGAVFVDASESGRLARHAGIPHTIGRQDWSHDSRQMAATLMFQIQDINWDTILKHSGEGEEYGTQVDERSGHRLFWGGAKTVETASAMREFGETTPRMQIKPFNAAEHDDGIFWLNTLLIYNVDGRYHRPNTESVETASTWCRSEALRRGQQAIDSEAFIDALQSFPGFDDVTLVRRDDGTPRTGETLYIRETIHATTGQGQFAVGRDAVENAGVGPDSGADARFYDTRIGLAYYWLDNNGYTKDLKSDGTELEPTANPVYLPYDCLTPARPQNLLLPGYAASISSQAWFEVRVLPNLCVLGDAAGVAAAVSLQQNVLPGQFTADEIAHVQEYLETECNAILNKQQSNSNPDEPAPTPIPEVSTND